MAIFNSQVGLPEGKQLVFMDDHWDMIQVVYNPLTNQLANPTAQLSVGWLVVTELNCWIYAEKYEIYEHTIYDDIFLQYL